MCQAGYILLFFFVIKIQFKLKKTNKAVNNENADVKGNWSTISYPIEIRNNRNNVLSNREDII